MIYEVPFNMFGVARIEADSAKEAESLAMEGCMGWSGDIDWEDADMGGCDIHDAEEV